MPYRNTSLYGLCFFVQNPPAEKMLTIDRPRKKRLLVFCRRLNLKFKNLELLELAFHHRSYSNENIRLKNINNERLEFLGDSVLGLVAADFLYNDMGENVKDKIRRCVGKSACAGRLRIWY